MADHKPCYGKMFPDVLPPLDAGRQAGKAFSFAIENIGLARGERSVDVDIDAWDECRRCAEFDHCYRLSMGTLALQTAIREA